ncbi:MAG: polysaccharide deacetylase family protein [Pyrinomonadaceae bacterium]
MNEPAGDLPVARHQVLRSTFQSQIDRFRGRILHPLEVNEELQRGRTPRGLLITFDDGAAGIAEAARLLAEAGTAGVAFICPGAFSKGLWFYRLADQLVRTRMEKLQWRDLALTLAQTSDRRRAYSVLSEELFDLPPSVRDEALAEIEAALAVTSGETHPALATLDEAGIRRAAERGGLVLANHTWSHPNLVKLSSADLKSEIDSAQSWLSGSGLPFVPWFAFPRGSYDDRVCRTAAEYCPVLFGASSRENAPDVLPRTYICQLDANQIRFGVKTALGGRLRQFVFWK